MAAGKTRVKRETRAEKRVRVAKRLWQEMLNRPDPYARTPCGISVWAMILNLNSCDGDVDRLVAELDGAAAVSDVQHAINYYREHPRRSTTSLCVSKRRHQTGTSTSTTLSTPRSEPP
jgi:hypothetical protein